MLATTLVSSHYRGFGCALVALLISASLCPAVSAKGTSPSASIGLASVQTTASSPSTWNSRFTDRNTDTSITDFQIFPTELEAVVHAMNTYNPTSIREDREYIGAVYELLNGQGYFYSVSSGRSGSGQATARLKKYAGTRFVAFWHTHGSDHWTRKYFSSVDTHLVKQWDLPFYMGNADGDLRVFRPGNRTLSPRDAQIKGLGRQSGFGEGELLRGIDLLT